MFTVSEKCRASASHGLASSWVKTMVLSVYQQCSTVMVNDLPDFHPEDNRVRVGYEIETSTQSFHGMEFSRLSVAGGMGSSEHDL
jgi:hypothetical protein